MKRVLVTLIALLWSGTAQATDWTGHWVLRSGDVAIFDFVVTPQGQAWIVSWRRPVKFTWTIGAFEQIQGPEKVVGGTAHVEDGRLHAVIDDPSGKKTTFLLNPTDSDRAGLSAAGFPIEAVALVRQPEAPALGPWNAAISYPTPRDYPTNAEMTKMFDADQAARRADTIDWTKLDAEDHGRRQRARAMLDAGELQSADDYFHAAFIFQHGDKPDDYLLAHILAEAAMARGRKDASWIAAATLDRYLQGIGRPQVLGTQYRCRDGHPSMEPFDPNLIPDPTRVAMSVPIRAEQEKLGESLCAGHPSSSAEK